MTTFYEIELDDCDGTSATIHVYSDGTMNLRGHPMAKVRRLARLNRESETDSDMPEFAREVMRRLEA